jgi:hypothetical protein
MSAQTPESATSPGRFRCGDRVRVVTSCEGGNPRTPLHLLGRCGVVIREYGVVHNPLDHHLPYPPMYSIVFALGIQSELIAELHDEWLEHG